MPDASEEVPEQASPPAATATSAPPPAAQPRQVVAAQPPPSTPAPAPAPAPASTGPLVRVIDGCRGAATDTEYLICSDRSLDDRAREIGGLIIQVREHLAEDPDGLRAFNSGQRAWFNGVKATCHDAGCVTREQLARMAALRAMLAN